MREIVFERDAINLPALHAALAAALRERLIGISTESGGAGVRIRVHLDEAAPAADEDTARTIIETHDAAIFTPDQQAEADRAAILAGLDKPWAEWTPADKDIFLHVLAGQMGVERA
ncbi:MAG: hypothetical protein JW910_01595 [Anaerolineae bacterium]|nr:hypothetical protein [Anaerolineae bacterium]